MAPVSPVDVNSPAPEGPPVDLPKLVKAGATFIDEMPGKQRYALHVDTLKAGLTWSWRLDAEGGETRPVKTSEASLRSAWVISLIAQGVLAPHGQSAATPPFLLSRELAKALRTGKPAKVVVGGLHEAGLKDRGTELWPIVVDGWPGAVSTVRATDGHLTLWYADDSKWPVLVAAAVDGQRYLDLKEVRTK